ncbi:MAG TPA: hypothetical protein VGD58_18995 [Herpetosiphonaceae bacterium]
MACHVFGHNTLSITVRLVLPLLKEERSQGMHGYRPRRSVGLLMLSLSLILALGVCLPTARAATFVVETDSFNINFIEGWRQ